MNSSHHHLPRQSAHPGVQQDAAVLEDAPVYCLSIRTTVRYRRAGKCHGAALIIDWLYALPVLALVFVPQANEMFYDLGGSAGFISTTLVSLYYPHLKAKFWDRIPTATVPSLFHLAPRQILLNAAILAWSARLGTFLFSVSPLYAHTVTFLIVSVSREP